MNKNETTNEVTPVSVSMKKIFSFIGICSVFMISVMILFKRNVETYHNNSDVTNITIDFETVIYDNSFDFLVQDYQEKSFFSSDNFVEISNIQFNIDFTNIINSNCFENSSDTSRETAFNSIPNLLPKEETIEIAEIKTVEIEEYKTAVLGAYIEIPKIQKENYISLDELSISYDMKLNVCTGLSKEDFVKLINDCPYDYTGWFSENCEYIYDVCNEYEINEIFFCGLIAAESGWKISNAHRNINNYISMMAGGGLKRFETLEEGITEAAKLRHDNYLTEGGCYYHGDSLSGVKKCFCPNSTTWEGLVYGCMSYFVQ